MTNSLTFLVYVVFIQIWTKPFFHSNLNEAIFYSNLNEAIFYSNLNEAIFYSNLN